MIRASIRYWIAGVAVLVGASALLLLAVDKVDLQIGWAKITGQTIVGVADEFIVTQEDIDLSREDMANAHRYPYVFSGRLIARSQALNQYTPEDQLLIHTLAWKEAESQGISVSEHEVQSGVERILKGPSGPAEYYSNNPMAPPGQQRLYRRSAPSLKDKYGERDMASICKGTVRRCILIDRYHGKKLDKQAEEYRVKEFPSDCLGSAAKLVVRLGPFYATHHQLEKETKPPSEEELQAMFEKYRTRSPGPSDDMNTPPFGYFQEPRAHVVGLFISPGAVASLLPLTETSEEIEGLFQEELKRRKAKQYPVMDWQKKHIRQAAIRDLCHSNVRKLERSIRKQLNDALRSGMGLSEACKTTLSAMKASPDEILDRPISPIDMRNKPIEEILKAIASHAHPAIDTIYIPTANDPRVNRLRYIRGTLDGTQKTVREALSQIRPRRGRLKWAGWKGFPNKLFVDSFAAIPVSLVDHGAIPVSKVPKTHPFFYQVATSDPIPKRGPIFAQQEFQSLQEGKLQPETSLLGHNPPRRRVDLLRGEFVWGLVRYEPAHAPKEMNEELRKQVEKDCRRWQGFQLAIKLAKSFKTPQDARRERFHFRRDEWFPRIGVDSNMEACVGKSRLMAKSEWLCAYRDFLFDQLFPPNLSPDNPTPVPLESERMAVFPVPASLKVILSQRIAYIPGSKKQIDNILRAQLNKRFYGSEARRKHIAEQYNKEAILQRTGYTPQD